MMNSTAATYCPHRAVLKGMETVSLPHAQIAGLALNPSRGYRMRARFLCEAAESSARETLAIFEELARVTDAVCH